MSMRTHPTPAADAPLVVFDFDHTLYDGDSGSHLFKWLIKRNAWRKLLALLIAPVFAPMIAFMPTRRRGISAFVWVGTLGMRTLADFNAATDRTSPRIPMSSSSGCCRSRLMCCARIAMRAIAWSSPPVRRRNSPAPSSPSSRTRICR